MCCPSLNTLGHLSKFERIKNASHSHWYTHTLIIMHRVQKGKDKEHSSVGANHYRRKSKFHGLLLFASSKLLYKCDLLLPKLQMHRPLSKIKINKVGNDGSFTNNHVNPLTSLLTWEVHIPWPIHSGFVSSACG